VVGGREPLSACALEEESGDLGVENEPPEAHTDLVVLILAQYAEVASQELEGCDHALGGVGSPRCGTWQT
jgi:hypothetical protein